MRTLILDHHDSFTYLLALYVAEAGGDPIVKNSDELTLNDIETLAPTHLLLSPGPGRPEHPENMGITLEVIERFGAVIPILGVCLGHQAIVHALGGKIIHAPEVMHGKKSAILHNAQGVFRELDSPLLAMRYHSLIADRAALPDCLQITAETADGIVMGVRHKTRPMEGVQFHPESIGTEHGKAMIKNFLHG